MGPPVRPQVFVLLSERFSDVVQVGKAVRIEAVHRHDSFGLQIQPFDIGRRGRQLQKTRPAAASALLLHHRGRDLDPGEEEDGIWRGIVSRRDNGM